MSSLKVKPGSLLTSDFKKSQRAKLRGSQGAQSPQGPQGVAGPSGATKVVVRHDDFSTRRGRPAEVATGGGIEITNGYTRDMMAGVSKPKENERTPTGWYARGYNIDSDGDDVETVDVRACVICASP